MESGCRNHISRYSANSRLLKAEHQGEHSRNIIPTRWRDAVLILPEGEASKREMRESADTVEIG